MAVPPHRTARLYPLTQAAARTVAGRTQKDSSVPEVFLLTQNGYVATRTIEGTFPDYRHLVRKEHHVTATVDRAELVSAVEQALPLVSERAPSCMFHLNERFEIHAENAESGGEYVNEIAAALDGEEIKVSVNPNYLLAMLRTMTAREVTLALRKSDEVIYVVSDTGFQWALIMPLTTKEPDTKATKESDQEVA